MKQNNKEKYIITKVERIIDGDTFKVLNNGLDPDKKDDVLISVRMRELDTSEKRSKDPTLKRISFGAKDYLSNLILEKKVKLTNIKFDKYHRILANVYLDNVDISKEMIKSGYGVEYTGCKRFPEEIWIRHFKKNKIWNKYE